MTVLTQSQPPHNPDFDNDGVITVTDVLQLLQLFGQPFTTAPCIEGISGCTDPEALNFNPNATVDDGSCITEQPEYPEGSVFCNGTPTLVVEVLNPATGRIWMDRNLGASQAATSSTDVAAYGDLYQWGRRSDGHQCRTSPTTNDLSDTDSPPHGSFILRTVTPEDPGDWRSPQNSNLWQGVNGINNPCPNGYRLPTEAELNAERLSWSTTDAAGALASPLKLPMAGGRESNDGSMLFNGTNGVYWTSTTSGTNSVRIGISSNSSSIASPARAAGMSIRCLKN